MNGYRSQLLLNWPYIRVNLELNRLAVDTAHFVGKEVLRPYRLDWAEDFDHAEGDGCFVAQQKFCSPVDDHKVCLNSCVFAIYNFCIELSEYLEWCTGFVWVECCFARL
ncbi:hypothetical protein BpHYR1_049346 [Brachionus plicatilis]|uniref:Uncharacterized protein n=1 Tax=Brachionus plicatilis TaxID=10195 RepID=A0A3M7PMB0_BRAPC|nr:hypothetical protein BpHYR1_049346 [Brachionus plicatilis]